MGGCTDCGKKGGCDTRKHGMFAAVDQALERLYPTRRWGERDEGVALEGGVSSDEGESLAQAIAARLGTLAYFQPGDADEWCDYIYVLCLGRTPALVEMRGHGVGANTDGRAGLDPVALQDDGDSSLDERYLRVALSGVARFVGVQEVAMTMQRKEGDRVITERARSGVFDPILLPRFQSLVAVFAEWDIRHLDFGEIVEAPVGFDDTAYRERFGFAPVIANYLFYPQPPTTVSTVLLMGADNQITSPPS